MLTFCTLFSGSSGNAVYIGTDTGALLVDCGMSCKLTLEAMAKAGLSPRALQGILVTHEHSDHTRGVGILSRKLGLPVYATEGTWNGMAQAVGEIPAAHRVVVRAGESFFAAGMEAAPFALPHDAQEPTGYRVFAPGHSVAVATDLGYFAPGVEAAVTGAEVVLLESNHDPDMLKLNPHYPMSLKRRILGKNGHLSNADSSAAAVRLLETGTRYLLLGHLSKENNTPDTAYRAAHAALTEAGACVGDDVSLHVAARYQPSWTYRLE